MNAIFDLTNDMFVCFYVPFGQLLHDLHGSFKLAFSKKQEKITCLDSVIHNANERIVLLPLVMVTAKCTILRY